MEQRNLLCTREMLDLERDHVQPHRIHPGPCILLGNLVDFPNPNVHPVPASRPTPSLDVCNLPDHHNSNLFYGNMYNNQQHQQAVTNGNIGGGGSTPSNFFTYNPYMIPSSSRISSVPLHYGSSDNLPSSSNYGVPGVSLEEYGRNNHFMENSRLSCKRKNGEGVPGNYHHIDGQSSSSSSSSLGGSLNSSLQPWEDTFGHGLGVTEAAAPINPSLYRASGSLSIAESGSQRSVRSRSGASLQLDPALTHHHNQLLQGNYMGRSFQPVANAWVEQLGSNAADGGNSNRNYAPPMPYLHGRSVNGGPLEIGSMNGQEYQNPLSSRNYGGLFQPPSRHLNHDRPPPPMHGMRGGQNYSYHSQAPVPSYRHLTNNMHGALNPRDGMESSGSRYPRFFPSNGDRMYRPQRRISQAAQEDINGRIRLLSSEDLAILEFSGFYGVGNIIDQHRDLRMDIDDLSYEELLALEERIGDVNTGLSEDSIAKCLKTRLHASCSDPSAPNQSVGMEQEKGTCTICQVEYEENEKVGTLECGHEYHVECIKQWLVMKNVCPICKTSALSVDKEEG